MGSFRPLAESRLAELDDTALVEYAVAARSAGADAEATLALRIFAFGMEEPVRRFIQGRIGSHGEAVVEEILERTLEEVPDFIWDGQELPIPVEDIVDSCYGLLVRDVEDMSTAPVPGGLAVDEWISGLLLPAQGEIWVNAEDGRRWPPRWRQHEVATVTRKQVRRGQQRWAGRQAPGSARRGPVRVEGALVGAGPSRCRRC